MEEKNKILKKHLSNQNPKKKKKKLLIKKRERKTKSYNKSRVEKI